MRLLNVILFLTITFVAFDQSFYRMYGGSLHNDEGKAIVECTNSDLVVGGVTEYGAGGTDIFLTRFTSSGQIIWSRTYGLSDDESGGPLGLFETSNGDLLCSFRSASMGQTRAAAFMRLDQNGNIIWQKRISTGSDSEWTRTIFEHDDGTIYVAATVNLQTFGSSDAVLTKLDAAGNLIWSKTLGTSSNDHIWSMIPLPNNEIMLNMNSQTLGPGSRSSLFVKVDANGNILSEVAYGGAGMELSSDVVYDPNIGYLVTGGTTSYGQGGRDAYVALFDETFNLQWFKTYGGPIFDHGATVEIIDNNHFVMYMNSDISNSGDKQLSIVGLNANGTTLYTKTIGGALDDYLTTNSSSALVHSNNLSRTYFTGAYTESNADVQAFLMGIDGSPQGLCSDTLITEAVHTPTVANVNFSEANLGALQNINLLTSTINPLIYDFCPCPIIPPTLSDTVICAGSTLSYNLNTSYNYEWLPSGDFSCSTCPDPDFIGTDTSQVKLLIENGSCIDSVFFSINVNPLGTPNVSGPDTLCASGSSVLLNNSISGQWLGNGIVDPVNGEFDPNGLIGNVDLIFEADNPCVENDTISVYVENVVSANITSAIDTLCFNFDTDTLMNLSATPVNGYWSGTAIYDSVNGYLDENFINAGPHMVYYTPYGRCVAQDSLLIDIVKTNTASILFQDTLCEFDSEVILDVQNGFDGIWSGNGISDVNSGVFDPGLANTGNNTIVFEPGNQCIYNDTIQVFVENTIQAQITTNDTLMCISDDPLLLNATPLSGNWSGFTDSTTNGNVYFSAFQNGVGSYTIHYSPEGTCVLADSITITVNDLNVVVQDSITLCQNSTGEIQYSPSGGIWSGQSTDEVINGVSIDPSSLAPGVYEYEYAVDNGCYDSDTLILTVLNAPDAELGNDTTICHDCEIELSPIQVSTGDSIYWSTGVNDQSITVGNEGIYSVYVENQFGCVDSASIMLKDSCGATLYIPNSFTPDDSGLNDVFYVYGENITMRSFDIYNRWGNIVYSKGNEPVQWDGTYRSRQVQDGVYVYKALFYQCDSKKAIRKIGHIVVLK